MTLGPGLQCSTEQFRDLLQRGREGDLTAMRRLAAHDLSVGQLGRLSAVIALHLQEISTKGGAARYRLGIVASHTTDFLAAALPACALRYNVALDCLVAGYGQVLQAVLDPASTLKGRVDGILICVDALSLGLAKPILDPSSASSQVEGALRSLRDIQAAVRSNIHATCMFTSLPPPPEPFFGSYDLSFAGAPATMIRAFNDGLCRLIEPGDAIIDIAAVASVVGVAVWYDPRVWFHAKLPFAVEHTARYADAVCATLAAATGRARKCLVLDLDDTLWGGTIGDDGLDGIVLGPGSAVGEAHAALQSYALELRSRGVMLAVCSKNDEPAALAPFTSHPEMILKRDHIATFVANWSDKAENLRTIAATLGIGIDALVFVDNNPAERELVRRELPEVAVPEVGTDPATYVSAIARGAWFDAVGITQEDHDRAGFYSANVAREAARAPLTDMRAYLASLSMVATVQPFNTPGRSRIAQLINKSNQFNLTSRRYDEGEVAEIAWNPSKFTLQARLKDRFGDSGMVSVVIFDKAEETWSCDTWLMSCRVLGRRLEEVILEHVVAAARESGATTLRGRYLPTARNALVAGHFRDLGFAKVADLTDGGTEWELMLASYRPRDVPIVVERPPSPAPLGAPAPTEPT